jgi:hypothetical protein
LVQLLLVQVVGLVLVEELVRELAQVVVLVLVQRRQQQ